MSLIPSTGTSHCRHIASPVFEVVAVAERVAGTGARARDLKCSRMLPRWAGWWGLGPELHSQQVVLISHPVWDQECIDKHPNDRDQHPHNCKRQDELSDGDAGAFEIKIVADE